MELYASSPVAKEVWDRADKYLLDAYGKYHQQSTVSMQSLISLRFLHHQHCQEQPQGAHHSLWWASWQGYPPELHGDDFRDCRCGW
jgi:fatty acid synthase subunit beta